MATIMIGDETIHLQTLKDILSLTYSHLKKLKSQGYQFDHDRLLHRICLRLHFLIGQHPECTFQESLDHLSKRQQIGHYLARCQTYEPDLAQLLSQD